MKIVKIIAIILTCVSCLSHPAIAATPWFNPGEKNGLYAHHPQYENYKDLIETPLRNLKVFDNFTLVDDFEAFMVWHDENTTGKFPDDSGNIAYQSEHNLVIEECLNNAKTLTGTSSVSSGIEEGAFTEDDYTYAHTEAQGRCQNVLSQRFMHNPIKGAKEYANILLYWIENDILNNINQTTKRMPVSNARRSSFTYATRSRVGDSLAHYALYHRLYGLSELEQKQVDKMVTTFAKDYDYYAAFKASGPNFRMLCNLGKGATVTPGGGNDHCGSPNLRIALGATLYGLEFNNQIVFDYGIRHLEIALATFDEHKAYTAQMHRGMMALGYARQIIAELDKFDYAFEKAFQLDFSEMATPHGVTSTEVYKELLVFAKEPERLDYYFFKNGYGGDRRGGNFKDSQSQLKEGKVSPEVFWEAFNLEDYYLLGGKMAYDHYPKEFEEYIRQAHIHRKWLIEGSINVGFSNIVLRQATGQIPTFSRTKSSKNLTYKEESPQVETIFDWSQDTYNGIYELIWSVENVNNPGIWEKGAVDMIALENGQGSFIKTATGIPGNKAQRDQLEIRYTGDSGAISLSGDLGLFEAERKYATNIKGSLNDDSIVAMWEEGDRIKLTFKKMN